MCQFEMKSQLGLGKQFGKVARVTLQVAQRGAATLSGAGRRKCWGDRPMTAMITLLIGSGHRAARGIKRFHRVGAVLEQPGQRVARRRSRISPQRRDAQLPAQRRDTLCIPSSPGLAPINSPFKCVAQPTPIARSASQSVSR